MRKKAAALQFSTSALMTAHGSEAAAASVDCIIIVRCLTLHE